jgi:formiminotetrahydrofolate cyclodeaminase
MVPPALELAHKVAERGNRNSASDAGVAAASLRTAADGAFLNVRINLGGIDDAEFKRRVLGEAVSTVQQARQAAQAVERVVDSVIG